MSTLIYLHGVIKHAKARKRRAPKPVLMLLPALLAVCLGLSSCDSSAQEALPTRAPAPTFTPTTPAEQAAQPVIEQPPTQEEAAPEANTSTENAPAENPAENADSEIASSDVVTNDEAVAVVPDTPADTPTPELQQPEAVVNIPLLNVRGGPGTTYNILGGVEQGERYSITGKNQAGDWWEIDFNGQRGWLFGQLVTVENAESVAVAANIPPPPTAPPPPPPTNTPVPQPVAQEPAPAPEEPAPAPEPAQNFPFQLVDDFVKCEPNAGNTYFEGFVRYNDNSLRNAVCVHIHFFEPRTTKCSGCDGVGDGKWGFSPFGGPAPAGTPIEIFVVECPDSLPLGGQNSGFTNLTPLSPKWTRTINESEQCTGITFVGG